MDLCLDDAVLPLDTAEWVGVTGGTENYGWSIVYDSQSYTNVQKVKRDVSNCYCEIYEDFLGKGTKSRCNNVYTPMGFVELFGRPLHQCFDCVMDL